MGEEFDAAHSVDDGIGVQRAGGEEDAEGKDFGRVDAEQVGEGGPEERGGEGERRRCAGDQGEDDEHGNRHVHIALAGAISDKPFDSDAPP